jgi:hypothetical protein
MKKFSKKGTIGTTITWFVAFVIIFFIMLIFGVVSALLASEKNVPVVSWFFGNEENSIEIEEGYSTVSYQEDLFKILNSPTDQGVSVRELIGLWHYNKWYTDMSRDSTFKASIENAMTELEYEYLLHEEDYKEKYLVTKGFEITIYYKKPVEGEYIKGTSIFSENYDEKSCVNKGSGCIELAGAYITTNSNPIYVILKESRKVKLKNG